MRDDINNVLVYYRSLNTFQNWFFPTPIKKALDDLNNAPDKVEAQFALCNVFHETSHTSVYFSVLLYFFSGLTLFSNSPIMDLFRKYRPSDALALSIHLEVGASESYKHPYIKQALGILTNNDMKDHDSWAAVKGYFESERWSPHYGPRSFLARIDQKKVEEIFRFSVTRYTTVLPIIRPSLRYADYEKNILHKVHYVYLKEVANAIMTLERDGFLEFASIKFQDSLVGRTEMNVINFGRSDQVRYIESAQAITAYVSSILSIKEKYTLQSGVQHETYQAHLEVLFKAIYDSWLPELLVHIDDILSKHGIVKVPCPAILKPLDGSSLTRFSNQLSALDKRGVFENSHTNKQTYDLFEYLYCQQYLGAKRTMYALHEHGYFEGVDLIDTLKVRFQDSKHDHALVRAVFLRLSSADIYSKEDIDALFNLLDKAESTENFNARLKNINEINRLYSLDPSPEKISHVQRYFKEFILGAKGNSDDINFVLEQCNQYMTGFSISDDTKRRRQQSVSSTLSTPFDLSSEYDDDPDVGFGLRF